MSDPVAAPVRPRLTAAVAAEGEPTRHALAIDPRVPPYYSGPIAWASPYPTCNKIRRSRE